MPATAHRPRGPRAARIAPPSILDAAQAVFSERGMAGGTVRAIARRAGCDPALIYYHYASKEALFQALMDRRLPPLAADLRALADPGDRRPSRERIWAALEAFHRHLGEDAGFRELFRGQIVQGGEAVRDAVAAHIRPVLGAMRALLLQGVERGELRPDLDPTLTAFFIGRMHLEILDLVPRLGLRLAGLPSVDGLHAVRRAWLDFVWRAISLQPTPIPEKPPCTP